MAQALVSPASFLIVIGGSAGSLDTILQVLSAFRINDRTALVIVLHRKSDSDSLLIDLFGVRSIFPVKEAEDKEQIQGGHAYLAPADYHLLLEKNHTFSLDYSEKINYSRPSIDVTFESAALSYGRNLLCVLLSGANADGTSGLRTVAQSAGTIIVQSPESAGVPFMPQYALNHLHPDFVLQPENMAAVFERIAQEHTT